jgi:hypothetical protein
MTAAAVLADRLRELRDDALRLWAEAGTDKVVRAGSVFMRPRFASKRGVAGEMGNDP